MYDNIYYCKYVHTNANLSFYAMQCWVTVSTNTEWHTNNRVVSILNTMQLTLNVIQLKARECYTLVNTSSKAKWLQNFEHVINTSVIGSPLLYQSFTVIWTCHENINNWFTIVMLIIHRTLKMSWTQQSLVHHCHINRLQNFENVMNTSVIGSPLWCQSFAELGHYFHVSHLQNFEDVITLT